MNEGRSSHYQSYLLRLWRDGAQGPWQASLQHTASGERHTFADLAGLLAFLQTQTADPAPTRPAPSRGDGRG